MIDGNPRGLRIHRLTTPLAEATVRDLRSGERVLLTGEIITARDAAHGRLLEELRAGRPLPVDLSGQVLYYVGPSPARPGRVIGSAGPTSSYRMDPFFPEILSTGLRAIIGKGRRGPEVRENLARFGAVYLGAVGGLGALLSGKISRAEVVAYPDLGPEAIYRFWVTDFPTWVVNDVQGGDLYEEGRREYARVALP